MVPFYNSRIISGQTSAQIDIRLMLFWCQIKLLQMANDGHIDSRLALQATRFKHYCIACKCCCHNFEVFTAVDALNIQLIAQAHSRPFTSSSLKCLVVSRNGNWHRAKSCLGLNNPLIGSSDYVICLAFTKVSPRKFRRFPILTIHRARKNDCRKALNTPIFREKISLLSRENRFFTT